ncbi:Nn.00g013830.m01.CDS01 [Neocucurbitaria sp. VM-36]
MFIITALLTSLLTATTTTTVLASPLTPIILPRQSATWQPEVGTAGRCNKTSDYIIGFYVGPQLETVVNDACAAMMPPCAYQDRVSSDTFCIQTIDWPLAGVKSSVQSANVETRDGNKLSGFDVRFIVSPAAQPAESAGVFWTVADCYGYFAYLLAGCHGEAGFGTGRLRVGGESSLNGTVFDISIVAEQQ